MPLVIIGMYMLTKNMLLNFILSLLLLIPSYNQSLKKIKIIKIKIKKHLKDMIHQIYFYRTTFIGTTFNYVLCMVALGSVVFWACLAMQLCQNKDSGLQWNRCTKRTTPKATQFSTTANIK